MYLQFEEQVNKALEGDKLAKGWIVNELRPLIISCSRKYGGQTTWEDDLLQEGALEILEALNVFDISKGVPFLGFIKVRLIHYYQNKSRKRKELLTLNATIGEEGLSPLDLLEDETINIEADCLEEEKTKGLYESIKSLNKYERTIIEDYYLKDKKLKEIATNIGVHYITASKQKARALKKLEIYLKDIG